MWYHIILCYAMLYYIILYCIIYVLYYIMLYYIIICIYIYIYVSGVYPTNNCVKIFLFCFFYWLLSTFQLGCPSLAEIWDLRSVLILQVLFAIVCPAAVSNWIHWDPGIHRMELVIETMKFHQYSLYNVRPPATIAKLVQKTPITMVYGMQITN